ncbi:MAG: hypothetical protein ACTSQ5_01940 [Promethearchaeota archaeon]
MASHARFLKSVIQIIINIVIPNSNKPTKKNHNTSDTSPKAIIAATENRYENR